MFGSKIISLAESNKCRWIAVNNGGFELYNSITSFFKSNGYTVVSEGYREDYAYIVFEAESETKKLRIATDWTIRDGDIELDLNILYESPMSVDILHLI